MKKITFNTIVLIATLLTSIFLYGRITAIADVFDVLASDHDYKEV